MIRFLQTKGRVQRVLLVGFLSIVCIMMVVTLVPGGVLNDIGSRGVGANSVAKVDGQDVTNLEVEQVARNIMQQRHIPEQFKSYIMPQAVDAVVLQKVYLREAKRLRLEATDEDLRYEMQHGGLSQALYPNGNFIGADQYRDLIATQFNLSVPQFEQELRNELTLRKVRSVIGAGVFVSDAEVHDAFLRFKTKVKFDYAVLSIADLEKSVSVDDSELRAYYEKNQQQFANTIPEQRKVKFVLVDPARLPNPAKASNDDLQSYYRQHAADFRVPESVKVRHILVKLPLPGPDGKVDAKRSEAAKVKAQDVLNQLHKGGDFATLAKKYSDDAATAKDGGSVGQLVQGSGSAPEIEKVAFALTKGQTSDLIPTTYGFEIIRVDDKVSAHARSLDEVRSEIEPVVSAQKNQKGAEQLARNVESQAKSNGLDKAAASNGLQVQEIGYFTRTDTLPGLGASPQFLDAVFGMKANAAPASVPLQRGTAVVQVTDVKPPATPTFEQVKDRLAAQLKQQKAQAMLGQKAQELSDKAHASHNLREAAKAVGATVKTSDLVAPDGQVPDLGAVASSVPQVFEMKPGDISQAINLGQKGAVIAMLDKQQPSDAEFAGVKDRIKASLLERKRSEAEEVFIASLRDRLEKEGRIVVDKKKMEALGAVKE
ncbi:MAG TPA: peptidyl-prolyl cis-trans isomerase [Candidatus Saccharimonadales bacterium]|nr:peptidyl-prolyl cis-trans isomerase [Candidatus Saccharimonadales bacterium]